MLETILTVLSSQLGKSVMDGLFKWLSFRKFQNALVDMFSDMNLDLLENYIEENGGSQEDVKKMRKKYRKAAEKEVTSRLSALFIAFMKK